MSSDPFRAGEQFMARVQFERPLFLLAHHDDEIPTAGLLQRRKATNGCWVTNSDGSILKAINRRTIGEIRKREGVNSVALAGVPQSSIGCLDVSEVETYRWMSRVNSGDASLGEAMPYFRNIRDRVIDAVLQVRPDAVFTLAWQGGHPEHDITHVCAKLAVDRLALKLVSGPPFTTCLPMST